MSKVLAAFSSFDSFLKAVSDLPGDFSRLMENSLGRSSQADEKLCFAVNYRQLGQESKLLGVSDWPSSSA